jgi:hypothetical protein
LQRRILRASQIDQRQTFNQVVRVRRQVQIADDDFDVFIIDERARLDACNTR